MIRHLVALRFKPDTPQTVKESLYRELAALDQHIDGILDFQVRSNVSVEDALVRGYRDLFWFDFRDTAVRDAYLADPTHQAIGRHIIALLAEGPDDIFVLDFTV
ncbi:MAG: Dabb family protein [Rhodobacteraceae bacterium]|nr:Dabb family protein [Paracoccaceae bacterium]